MTDEAGPPSEIEIQTNESPTVYTRSFVRTDDQDVLTTTASNAEVVLTRNWERISDAHDWVAPLGILLSIGLGLLTTDFVARFGVGAEVWKAIFMVGAAGSAVWLVRELILRWRRGHGLTPQQVVALLMTPPPTSETVLAEARSVDSGKSARPQTYRAGSQVKATASAAERAATEDHVSMPTPRRPTSATVQDQARESKASTVPDSTNSDDLASKVSSGERVRHPNFGVGTVLDVRPGPGHTFVEVRFDDPDVGTKKLRGDRTPLRPVDDELIQLRRVEDEE